MFSFIETDSFSLLFIVIHPFFAAVTRVPKTGYVHTYGEGASSCDKDCPENLRVFFTDCSQPIIDSAYSVKPTSIDVLNVFMNVEPVPFHKGFYSVDMTYFFQVKMNAYTSPLSAPSQVCGLATFCKKVVLFGSEGSVKVFTNDQNQEEEIIGPKYLPKVVVQVAEPMILSSCIRECPEISMEGCCTVPSNILKCFNGSFECVLPQRIVEISLGLFSIVQMERQVQMMVPIYDFCIPDKECPTTSDNPCDVFKKIKFPIDEFFPPRIGECSDSDCGCSSAE